MGTTDGAVVPSAASSIAWDVPVRLVPRTALRSEGGCTNGHVDHRVDHRVDVGLDLPGIDGVIATTCTARARTLLTAIRPAAASAGDPAVPLVDLLAEIAVNGVVEVLVEGTPFTLAVLEALVTVPVGRRCTYAELALRAGRPRAVRAAAHVMATNRIPLVLPCHRVVPSGGGTGRYGWGDVVKPVLLDAEAEVGCRPRAAPPTLRGPHASHGGRARVPGGIA